MSNKIPPSLLRSLIREHHIEEIPFVQTHVSGEQVTSIRLNPFKRIHDYDEEETVPWCSDGKYLRERPSFIADPLFHAGCYYVQEASSMFLDHLLRQTGRMDQQLRVLDLCAAPGGKSTLLASLLSRDSLLVSNEIIKSRVPALSDNLTKWGNLNVIVTNNDPKDFKKLEGYFDVMVVDAPCSGSGMFRKDPVAVQEWSENNVQLCSERQQRILADALPALRENGILIYSTCSYSSEENEQIADWLTDTYSLQNLRIPLQPEWGIRETASEKHGCYGYRFYPHLVKGEGFFVSCFIKEEGSEPKNERPQKPPRIGHNELSLLKSWVKELPLSLISINDSYYALPESLADDIRMLQTKLYLKKSGIHLGKIAGKDFVPDQELAQSLLANERIERTELSREQALKYLRKDPVEMGSTVRGWTLMCYRGFGLGWAKILPNRINNYYPRELRILKQV